MAGDFDRLESQIGDLITLMRETREALLKEVGGLETELAGLTARLRSLETEAIRDLRERNKKLEDGQAKAHEDFEQYKKEKDSEFKEFLKSRNDDDKAISGRVSKLETWSGRAAWLATGILGTLVLFKDQIVAFFAGLGG